MTERLTVVTGAAAGMGRSIAARLLNEGSRVVGLDIRPLPPFDTDRWTGLVCDVSDEQGWAGAISQIVSDFGAPDALAFGFSTDSGRRRGGLRDFSPAVLCRWAGS